MYGTSPDMDVFEPPAILAHWMSPSQTWEDQVSQPPKFRPRRCFSTSQVREMPNSRLGSLKSFAFFGIVRIRTLDRVLDLGLEDWRSKDIHRSVRPTGQRVGSCPFQRSATVSATVSASKAGFTHVFSVLRRVDDASGACEPKWL